MARKKVKLALILNESTRTTCCKKRTKGLLKKVNELSTLCGLEMAVIANIPNNPQPDVWPSVPDAIRTVEKFKALPEVDRNRKKMNQESFFRQRIEKLNEEANKLAKRNQEIYTELVLYHCLKGGSLDGLSSHELDHLVNMIDDKVKAVDEAISNLKNKETHSSTVRQEGSSLEEEIGGNKDDDSGHAQLPPEMQFLKEQTWFMEAMDDPDIHVGLSSAMSALKPYNGDDFVDGFTGQGSDVQNVQNSKTLEKSTW